MSITITPHEEYTLMAEPLDNNRRAVKGSFFIKAKQSLLPHPSQVDTSSPEQKARYAQYVAGAEFPEFTKTTLASMLGKMKIDQSMVEVDDKLSYLLEDTDGDGLSIDGLLESCASNSLQAKWHLLLTDFKGLSDTAIDELSVADREQMNARATINQYTRENVIDWYYSRINGRMQLVYVLLREKGSVLNPNTLEQESAVSYLRLVLTEDGYYQQKLIGTETGGYSEGEKHEIRVGGQPLKFIPVEIASDCELPVGCMPMETGFLTGIVDLALYAYRVSADYKESLRGMKPMVNVFGIDEQAWKTYKEVNGRDYTARGGDSVNLWDKDVKVELLNPEFALTPFTEYKQENATDVRAIGGVYNTENAVQRSATEILTESNASNAILQPLASSTENAVKRSILYCGMFEGIYPAENLSDYMDKVQVEMPREFAISKLSADEVRVLMDMRDSGEISSEEFIKTVKAGGWLTSEVDEIVNASVDMPPTE